uniref:Uncharacterized protein n=1 Tax=Aegilops tauschii subsp. strangulata TaxID=200361 RepID=A0A453HYM9_AEGTS
TSRSREALTCEAGREQSGGGGGSKHSQAVAASATPAATSRSLDLHPISFFATVTPVQALPLPEATLGRRHPPHPLCTSNLSFRFRSRLLIGVDPQPKHEHRSRQTSSPNSATGAWLPCGLNLGARQQSNQRGELWLWMRGG